MRRAKGRPAKSTQDRALPKYSIAVASDIAGVPQQQLRRMEDNGLIAPGRTKGKTRRYSDADLERVAEVTALTEQGVNAEGIRQILELRNDINNLQRENTDLRHRLVASREASLPSNESPIGKRTASSTKSRKARHGRQRTHNAGNPDEGNEQE